MLFLAAIAAVVVYLTKTKKDQVEPEGGFRLS
jgi:hypothetical protein